MDDKKREPKNEEAVKENVNSEGLKKAEDKIKALQEEETIVVEGSEAIIKAQEAEKAKAKQDTKVVTDKDEKKEEKTESKKADKDEEKEEKTESKKADKDEVKEEKTESKKADKDEVKEEKTESKKADKDEVKEEKTESKKADKDEVKEEKTESKKADKDEVKEEKQTPSKEELAQEIIKNQQMKKKGKGPIIALCCVLGVFLIAYIAGFVYFSGHFYQDVAINGTDVSGMNKETAKQTLDNFYKDYVLTLTTIDGDNVVIDGDDVSIQIVLHDEFSNCLKKQQAYIWFVNMFKHHDYQVGADVTWDEDELMDVFKDMDILKDKNMEEPVDACIGVKDDKFAIVKEVLGTTLDKKVFQSEVEKALSEVYSTLVLKDAGCYVLPKVYQDDEALANELAAKSEVAKGVIKLQLDDLTLEPGMDLYDNVLDKKGDSYEISEKLVKKYVKSLADEYDTLGKERTFTTSWNDKKVETLGTAFGYEMNQEETADALLKALKAGKSTTVDVVFDSKGYTLKGENDIGDTYIEVNLSEQKVFAYKNGKKLADADCVSGSEGAGHGTCIGLYAIQDKLSPTVLRGEKKPVTKTTTKKKKGKKVKVTKTTYEYEYESPVTFWMQFNGGIGLHDAAGWRSSYGGSIYRYNGSHGCVNLPYDFAKILYENFDVGDPVIVYFWDNENRE